MIIGILSDTHDNVANLTAAFDFFVRMQVTAVVHCGDWKSMSTLQVCREHASQADLPVYGVLGNNDLAVAEMLAYAKGYDRYEISEGILRFELDGKRIAAYHGHHKPTLRRLMEDMTADIICLGHTHKPLITQTSDRLIVNPGSTAFAIPRSKTWRPTVALIDTSAMAATIHFIDEMSNS